MLEVPDTLHNIVALILAGAFVCLGWSCMAWLWGLIPLWGRVVVACVLAILAVLLLLGRL